MARVGAGSLGAVVLEDSQAVAMTFEAFVAAAEGDNLLCVLPVSAHQNQDRWEVVDIMWELSSDGSLLPVALPTGVLLLGKDGDDPVAVTLHRLKRGEFLEAVAEAEPFLNQEGCPRPVTLREARQCIFGVATTGVSALTSDSEPGKPLLKNFRVSPQKATAKVAVGRGGSSSKAESSDRFKNIGKAKGSRRTILESSGDEDDFLDPLEEDNPALRAAFGRMKSRGTELVSGSRRKETVEETVEPASEEVGDVNGRINLEILKILQQMQGDQSLAGTESVDGVRVMKAMSRLRSLRSRVDKKPMQVVKDYHRFWEEELNADGRPWSWDYDVRNRIQWKEHRSMLRVWVMFSSIMSLLDEGRSERAHAQCVQCMKATHQFVNDGVWRVAWNLTFLPDPIVKRRHGGTEEEIEAILGSLKASDDLDRRTTGPDNPDAQAAEKPGRNGANAKGGAKGQPDPP